MLGGHPYFWHGQWFACGVQAGWYRTPWAGLPPVHLDLLRRFPPAREALTARWAGEPLEGTLVAFDGMWWWRRNYHESWIPTCLPTEPADSVEHGPLPLLDSSKRMPTAWKAVMEAFPICRSLCGTRCGVCKQGCVVHTVANMEGTRPAALSNSQLNRCACPARFGPCSADYRPTCIPWDTPLSFWEERGEGGGNTRTNWVLLPRWERTGKQGSAPRGA